MTDAFGYGRAAEHILQRGLDWANDTVQCGLFSSSYTPDQDAHEFVDDLTNEVTDVTYSRQTLTSKVLSYSTDDNAATCLSDEVGWTGLNATFRYVVFWKWTGSDATSPLLFYIDYGADQTPAYIDWPIPVPSTGYMSLQV